MVGTLPLRLGNCWAWFDGSLRAGLGAIGVINACWGAGGTGEPDAVLMESHCLGGGHGDITLLEAKALELAVTRLADGRKQAWPGSLSHADWKFIVPEIMAWIGRRTLR